MIEGGGSHVTITDDTHRKHRIWRHVRFVIVVTDIVAILDG